MLTIREEVASDIDAIRYVNKQAFGQDRESNLIDALRKNSALSISLVAHSDNSLVGHVAFSPASIINNYTRYEIITLAPLAVLPSHQHQGIGSELVRTGIEYCPALGYEIVVVVGYPEYYRRFGFIHAKSFGIDCEFEVPDEVWMVCELVPGALQDKYGTVYFRPEFKECL